MTGDLSARSKPGKALVAAWHRAEATCCATTTQTFSRSWSSTPVSVALFSLKGPCDPGCDAEAKMLSIVPMLAGGGMYAACPATCLFVFAVPEPRPKP